MSAIRGATRAYTVLLTLCPRYVLRVPSGWNAATGSRPIVFMHGLGLGLSQYFRFIQHLFVALPDQPVLIPLLPHVSQELLHPRFLRPMGRAEMAQHLAELIEELGWAELDDPSADSSDSEAPKSKASPAKKGVTMLSHSKSAKFAELSVRRADTSHSGSFGHAWLLKAHANMITRSCFVDLVTFCSWEGGMFFLCRGKFPSTLITPS